MMLFLAALFALLMIWAIVRCGDVFEALWESNRTADYRFAVYCGRNPHDPSLLSCDARQALLMAGRR